MQEDRLAGKLGAAVEHVVLLKAVCGIVFITVIGAVWFTGRTASKSCCIDGGKRMMNG